MKTADGNGLRGQRREIAPITRGASASTAILVCIVFLAACRGSIGRNAIEMPAPRQLPPTRAIATGDQSWRNDGSRGCRGVAPPELRYSRRKNRHEPPHRHRRGRTRDPRQLRRRADASRATRSPPTPTAREALAAFRTRLPDLALIDIGLGDEHRRRLRAVPRAARAVGDAADHLPSARDSDFDIVSGLRLGADDYLTKDVEPAAARGAHRRAVPAQRPAARSRRRPRTCSSAARSRST